MNSSTERLSGFDLYRNTLGEYGDLGFQDIVDATEFHKDPAEIRALTELRELRLLETRSRLGVSKLSVIDTLRMNLSGSLLSLVGDQVHFGC